MMMAVASPKIMIPAIVCMATVVGLAELGAHMYMKPYVSNHTKSYHVSIGGVHVWPASVYGVYCSSYRAAKNEFNKCVKQSPKTNYRIQSYPAVVRGYLFPVIIGVTGECALVEENKH